jgi:hypothetical protein
MGIETLIKEMQELRRDIKVLQDKFETIKQSSLKKQPDKELPLETTDQMGKYFK